MELFANRMVIKSHVRSVILSCVLVLMLMACICRFKFSLYRLAVVLAVFSGMQLCQISYSYAEEFVLKVMVCDKMSTWEGK